MVKKSLPSNNLVPRPTICLNSIRRTKIDPGKSMQFAIFKDYLCQSLLSKMSDIKKITNKILLLILDVLCFTFQTVKQVVLPNRKRKGNILSSGFDFFIGIIERLHQFEHGYFKPANVYKLKYLKQCILITAAFLFFLSSFEWKPNRELNYNTTSASSLQFSTSSENTISVKKQKQPICISENGFLIKGISEIKNTFYEVPSSSSKKYILSHRLRI
jgi:hypothetical protein